MAAIVNDTKENCNSVLLLTVVEDNLVENKRLKLDAEKTIKQQVDIVPKDTGWAWMCCLGT